MHWQSDVSVADWIAPRLGDWATDHSMHIVVPRGYAAYARIFHPATRRTLPGSAVPSADDIARMPDDEATRVISQFVDSRVTWEQTARAFGTTMHAGAQWHAVTKAADVYADHSQADGAEYTGGQQGFIEPELLAAIVQSAVNHTSTPVAGFAAVWEGWGDLVGSLRHIGQGSARFSDSDPHESLLARLRTSMFDNPYGKKTWHAGILDDDISRGARLSLPGRDHVLFATPLDVFTEPSWQESVLWRDPTFPSSTHSPTLLWPEDRAWVVVSEIDWDSTIVGGSTELIAALVADPRLEAWEVPAESRFTFDADEING